MSADDKIPRATYRLQFNKHFRLTDAIQLIPYFCELGISHIYASPLLKACPGSTHGYDICDFEELNPEIGTEADLEKFVSSLREKKMGIVLDIVPNHMGICLPQNHWWRDVLARGRKSEFADFFDIDWESPDPKLRGKILLPILGDECERVLERGELKLKIENGETILNYFENQFPIAPDSIPKNSSIEQLNSNPAALDQLIQNQNYRLEFWRSGDRELNYRRFFNIATLAGIRVESEKVFERAHSLIKNWLDKNWPDGLRVDHPDGLRDPENYLRRLRDIAPGKWIVVEKILGADEQLPGTWPVAGTSGYDFLNQVNGLFINPNGEKPLTNFYAEFTGRSVNYSEIVLEKKRFVLREMFVAEVNRLAGILNQIASRENLNFTREEISEAMIEIAARLPVYRTYARPDENFFDLNELDLLEKIIADARKNKPKIASGLFDFLREILTLRRRGNLESEFIWRFQQLTGPAAAKGGEDTAFYCFNRFIALNEVGGDPGKFGISVEAFHKICRARAAHWPNAMLATSTHDTKRSEDVRARLDLLSEIPAQWTETIRRWSKMNEHRRKNNFSDRNAEYFFYQTIVGAWPISTERALACMEKAARETKEKTSWNNPNADYENALREFVVGSLADSEFTSDVEKFVASLANAGFVNSLAQTLIKLTAPGAPDIYQGNEIGDFSLVDPDNRRPVDFELRRNLLAGIKNFSAEQILKRCAEGLSKLWLIWKVLQLRRAKPELFAGENRYEPIYAIGKKSTNAVAFSRGENLITIVPRLILGLNNDWQNTTIELPRGNWRNALTGETISDATLDALTKKFPVVLLVREEFYP